MMTKTKISVYVMVDNDRLKSKCVKAMEGLENVVIVGQNANPIKALNDIKGLKPNIIISSVLMPHMDGASFYEKVSSIEPLSNVEFMFVIDQLPEVTMQMLKGIPMLSVHIFPLSTVELRAQFEKSIMQYKDVNLKGRYYTENQDCAGLMKYSTPAYEVKKLVKKRGDDNVKEAIDFELYKMGAKPTLKGYGYIVDMTKLLLESNDIHNEKFMELYHKIGVTHNASVSSVERSIRSCIKNMWEDDSKIEAFERLNYDRNTMRKQPSNSDFLSRFTYGILRDYVW